MEQTKKTNHIMLIITIFIVSFLFFRYCLPFWWIIQTLWFLGLILITTIYLYKNWKYNKKQIPYTIFLILSAISYSIYTNHGLTFFQNLLFIASFIYLVLVACKTRTNDKIDENTLSDTLYQSLPTIVKKTNTLKNKNNNRWLIIGLIVFIPIFVLILALLSASSLVFNYYLWNILNSIRIDVLVILISIPITISIFRIIFHNIQNFKHEKNNSKFKKQNTLFHIILTVFSIIYILFIISSYLDIIWFIPKDVSPATIAQYARSWFFELFIVTIINIWIFIATKKLTDSNTTNKVLLSSIGICTIAIIMIALYKMYTYIQTLWLTLLRFNTSFFMICLLIAVILAIIWLRKKFNYIWISISFIALLFLALCFFNEEWFITTYNVKQALNWKITLDKTIFASDIQAAKYLQFTNSSWAQNISDLAEEYLNLKILEKQEWIEITLPEEERLHHEYIDIAYDDYVTNAQEYKKQTCEKTFGRKTINYTMDYMLYHKNLDKYCE